MSLILAFTTTSVSAVVLAPLNVKLTGIGDSQVRYGAYSGLYQLEVNGATVEAMCDDKFTDVYIGDTWTANRFTYADIIAGAPVKFASSGIYKYSQVGYLFSLLGGVSSSDTADINLAVWNIMSPGSIALTTTAESYYNTAVSGAYDSFNYNGIVDFLTPSPLNASQEYAIRSIATVPIATVPIPATIWLFGSGIIGVVGVARRKI